MKTAFFLLAFLMFWSNNANAQNIFMPSLKQLLVQKGYAYSSKQDKQGNYAYYFTKDILLIALNENKQNKSLKNMQATLMVDNQPIVNLQNAVNDLSAFFYQITDNSSAIAKWLTKCLARNNMNVEVQDKKFQYKCFMLGHSSVFLATPIK